jgi:vancomycin resistance protein VanW
MIALQSLNGIQIQPGETFSFWWLVGSPTAKRGYQKGLVIQQGRAEKGWGGGLCQLSNMIHYLALHSDLEIVERHRHSFDLFPDDNRIIPFGTGATVSFNYKDLQIHNPTDWTYQMLFEMDDKRLAGGLLCSELPDRRYVVLERGQGFKQVNGVYWRENTVIRIINDLKLGLVGEEVLFRNKCECRYNPREVTN